MSIDHGFKPGNFSHIYEEESPINEIVKSKKAEVFWESALNDLDVGKSEGKLGLKEAINQSLDEIMQFLEQNHDKLALQDEERGTVATKNEPKEELTI